MKKLEQSAMMWYNRAMFFGFAKIIITLEPYVLPVIMGAVALVAGGACVIVSVRQIRRQVKLYNSISLVELKTFKFHYWVFILLFGLFMFYIVTQMADPEAPEAALMLEAFKMKRWQTNLMLGFLLTLCVCATFLLVVLARSKSAVVDRGVYAGMRYLDWYHVHDYIIDEDKGVVILTSNKYTFATLSGTTSPLKVAKNDIPKLKFILNKNKNKFSGFSDDKF